MDSRISEVWQVSVKRVKLPSSIHHRLILNPSVFVSRLHYVLRLPVNLHLAERHVLRHMADFRVRYFRQFKFSSRKTGSFLGSFPGFSTEFSRKENSPLIRVGRFEIEGNRKEISCKVTLSTRWLMQGKIDALSTWRGFEEDLYLKVSRRIMRELLYTLQFFKCRRHNRLPGW